MRAPSALVVQNDPNGPPARLGEWLVDAGLPVDLATPYEGGRVPKDLRDHCALVVLGGHMSAWEDDQYPWLTGVKALLRQAVDEQRPTLAVCLGAQLLAVAAGGSVHRGSDGPETGPALVAKRDVAASDPLFQHVPFTPDVVQWHNDAITTLPPGAVLLASSPRYPNQAFRLGERVYGLQFHIETTPDMVREWASRGADDLAARGVDPNRLLARLDEAHADVEDVWRPFTRRFVEMARRVVP